MTSKHALHPAVKTLEKYKNIIWPEIDKHLVEPVFPSVFTIPRKYKSLERFHRRLYREYPLRKGKYVRPTLLLLTASAMGTDIKYAINTAAAMQISEEWILLDDDIQDGSTLRRGKPTLHRMFGFELALNAGDTLQTIMWKVLPDNQPILGDKKSREISEEFYSIIRRTELGQTVEIKWFKENKIDFTDEDWFFIADSKSSYYSITGPIRLGAIIANATEKQLDTLTYFGLNLGRSFQLIDDLLDITSNFKGLKQKGNDIYEGKRTILLGHLLRSIDPKNRNKLISILGKTREEKDESEVDWVIEKMQSYGSIDYAKKLAQKYKDKALTIFEKDLKFLSREPHREHLRQLINFIIEREY